jgi:hypothetical protein
MLYTAGGAPYALATAEVYRYTDTGNEVHMAARGRSSVYVDPDSCAVGSIVAVLPRQTQPRMRPMRTLSRVQMFHPVLSVFGCTVVASGHSLSSEGTFVYARISY